MSHSRNLSIVQEFSAAGLLDAGTEKFRTATCSEMEAHSKGCCDHQAVELSCEKNLYRNKPIPSPSFGVAYWAEGFATVFHETA